MVKTLYICNVCKSKFPSRKLANKCENSNIFNADIKLGEFYASKKTGTMLYIMENWSVTRSRGAHERVYYVLDLGSPWNKHVGDDLWQASDLKPFKKMTSKEEFEDIPTKLIQDYIKTTLKKNSRLGKRLSSKLKKNAQLL